jgi:hypothetical protein
MARPGSGSSYHRPRRGIGASAVAKALTPLFSAANASGGIGQDFDDERREDDQPVKSI